MSEETTATRKRSASAADEGKVVTDYEEAPEVGYIGGPVDETDHTVAGEIAAAKKAQKNE